MCPRQSAGRLVSRAVPDRQSHHHSGHPADRHRAAARTRARHPGSFAGAAADGAGDHAGEDSQQRPGGGAVHLGVTGVGGQRLDRRAAGRAAADVSRGDCAVPVCQHGAGDFPRHPGTLDPAVRPAEHPGDYPDAAALGRHHTAGQHADLAAVGDAGVALDPLCQPVPGDPVPPCQPGADLAGAAGPNQHRPGVLRHRPGALSQEFGGLKAR